MVIRIGILGTDNSHSIGYSQFFNDPKGKDYIPGAKVVALYGDNEKRNMEVAEKGKVPTIVKKPTDLIGMIDAAIVDFRHGSRHLQFAAPMIKAGIPTFIDKPFAASVADAKKIVALAKKHRTPITTFSSLRFGTGMEKCKKEVKKAGKMKALVTYGPGSACDPYDGIFFYAVHQVEFMLEVFGTAVKSARGMNYDGMLVATVTYKNGLIVTMHEINAGWPQFTAAAFGDKTQVYYDYKSAEDGFRIAAATALKMFKTGKMPYTYKEMTASTRVLEAINKSMQNDGKEIAIKMD
jgi:predicted dehydrogenase